MAFLLELRGATHALTRLPGIKNGHDAVCHSYYYPGGKGQGCRLTSSIIR